MNKFIALLRGVNVGGNSKLSMAELKSAMTEHGLGDITTYINSGNVIFSSSNSDTVALASTIQKVIKSFSGLDVDVIVLPSSQWQSIVNSAPKWWGHDESRKHNLLVLLPPYSASEAMAAIGELKDGIESAETGDGVIYQSLSLQDFGKTTTGKLASSPIYKRMTIRNYNTTTKLAELLLGDKK